jgi:multicomponent Na+:H+ antiporter subunit G
MKEFITLFLLLAGTTFIVLSAIGVIRMPDLYLRMSSSTKSSTLGVGLVMLAATVYFSHELGTATRAVAIIFFLVLTAPVAAHMIGRAAYYNGVPLWRQTRFDDLKGKHNPQEQTVAGLSALEGYHPSEPGQPGE